MSLGWVIHISCYMNVYTNLICNCRDLVVKSDAYGWSLKLGWKTYYCSRDRSYGIESRRKEQELKSQTQGVGTITSARHEVDTKLLRAVPRCISSRHRWHDLYRVGTIHAGSVWKLWRNAEIWEKWKKSWWWCGIPYQYDSYRIGIMVTGWAEEKRRCLIHYYIILLDILYPYFLFRKFSYINFLF